MPADLARQPGPETRPTSDTARPEVRRNRAREEAAVGIGAVAGLALGVVVSPVLAPFARIWVAPGVGPGLADSASAICAVLGVTLGCAAAAVALVRGCGP